MKKNVGLCDAFIRITLGLIGLSYSTARMAQRPYGMSPFIITILSAIKIAEGITRFCPLLAMLGISTENEDGKRPYRIYSYPRRFK
ncbi:YgaP family membrane protein [Aneurinibacillus aneurinilyticus]|jgi:hypothetical protein|uniref:DUF2892 domain-containing protein n=2 Tax=Aneurinibacillus aneurinilyticus TaxID=1391 RepID=A0A848CYB4_ANEAE|nr:DUF2892 domain-containing protein [Aneurinibacillus aneurinilyticus]ERI08684.1 hypothetical protein HMPREF0083_03259 [Aneurinibacillus aneurinilyticus ATCC 12856]MCI1694042.1 DUF2892 domain-containing protein [Aneurinibacillus aneurinilyticus]MED0671282.1 DUF2892 domain-containing protein [Aneurinibacillus aneurinilyticus]MED0708479.1 DUF2892 domain-containing protein [Aneurinibacillus aneurinilyticus]MED0723201.1 DUF2892 domain-containing protein [Aneurinibacillus aneurinilyticus]